MDHFFEVTIRKLHGKWVVLAVLDDRNAESSKESLSEALHEAAAIFQREALRYGQNTHSSSNRDA